MLLLPLLQATGQNPGPLQILEKSRELSLAGSMSASISLVITEKNGAIRRRTISLTTGSYPGGTEKRLIRFVDPPDVRGTAMLIIDNRNSADEMWIYLPALKKTRRIVTAEKGKSFMSSEFSNADMTSPTLSDFTNRYLEKSGTGNQWIIESEPVNDGSADEYGFSKKISYIGKDDYVVRKMEFYNFDNKLFKIIEIRSIHPLPEGRYIVQDMTAENLTNGRKSEIKFSNIEEGIKIDDSFFSVQNLER